MTRWVRVLAGGRATWAREEGEGLVAIEGTPWAPGLEMASLAGTEARLAPATPTKVVCVGRNYRAHAAELGNAVPDEPLLFLKPPSAVAGPGAAIEVPGGIGEVHHEAELALCIGTRLDHTTPAEAVAAGIFGLLAANDVTARTIQRAEKKFTRAKGFDTFCPVGPALVTGLEVSSVRRVRCLVDGEVRQDGTTDQMVFGPVELVRFIASCMTLEPGDLVLTGTPAGVGPIEAGQTVTVEVEGVGTLTNPVVPR